MNELYLNMAEGYQKLADCYKALAEGHQQEAQPEPQQEAAPTITIEDVRAVLGEKSQKGKTREVKALLLKYDAGKLSGVKPEDYPALLAEAEAL